MKNKNKKLPMPARISNASGIPFDMASKNPYIKLCCNREAIIEDAGKLVRYDSECVKVMQGKNVVSLSGRNLKIIFLTGGDIMVCGFITSVCFE